LASASVASFWDESLARGPGRAAYLVPEGRAFRTVTYQQAWDTVYKTASALDTLGLAPGDRLAILGDTGFEWAMADWAAQALGIVTVPAFPTLPADQVELVFRDAQVSAVVAQDAKQAAKCAGLGVPVVEFGELGRREGRLDRGRFERTAGGPAQTDLATIIYTSGTTGEPKGAMLSHEGIVALCRCIPSHLPLGQEDVFLSWLPVAHVFERFAGHFLPVSIGAAIGYANSVTTLASDMAAVRPTIVLVVPRFLASFRARIEDSVRSAPPFRRKLFALAVAQGRAKASGGFAPLFPLTDSLVGRKLRERAGGRLRFFVSGGAALSPELSGFFDALGLEVLQGYGLTETTAASSLNVPGRKRPETVGEPFRIVEAKIAPDGEILLRGPSVMRGYWRKPEATAEAIDADGWFHTGDVGVLEGGHLRITDRKKDIQVLANGKNVAPQRVEDALRSQRLIAEAVVFGDGLDHCVALIVPDYEALRARLGLAAGSPEAEVAAHLGAASEVKADVDLANRALADFERVRQFRLLPAPFSVEAGDLTPSMKVKRKVVRERYAAQLAEMS
jgi:long-chain acyl-CoA synthetase